MSLKVGSNEPASRRYSPKVVSSTPTARCSQRPLQQFAWSRTASDQPECPSQIGRPRGSPDQSELGTRGFPSMPSCPSWTGASLWQIWQRASWLLAPPCLYRPWWPLSGRTECQPDCTIAQSNGLGDSTSSNSCSCTPVRSRLLGPSPSKSLSQRSGDQAEQPSVLGPRSPAFLPPHRCRGADRQAPR